MSTETSRTESGGGEWQGLFLPVNRVDIDLTWSWLRRGWRDFTRALPVSLAFGIVIALLSLLILYMMWQTRLFPYAWPLAAGFMFVAPLLGLCFYEISRRLEQNRPVNLLEIAFAWKARAGSIFALGLVMMLFQIAWFYLAILLYALFFGDRTASWNDFVIQMLLSQDALPFLAIGTLIGAALAVIAFALSVISFPILLDRDIGAAQAIATSISAFLNNWRVLLGWGALIVLFTGAGILTACIGLAVTMPLLGHASWHAYRDLVGGRPQ